MNTTSHEAACLAVGLAGTARHAAWLAAMHAAADLAQRANDVGLRVALLACASHMAADLVNELDDLTAAASNVQVTPQAPIGGGVQ